MKRCDVCNEPLEDGVGTKGGAERCGGCKGHDDRWDGRPLEDIKARGDSLDKWKLRNDWSLAARSAKARANARARVAQTRNKVRESIGATRH